MASDLFQMLNQNKFNLVLENVEDNVTKLVANRHEYPLWPMHNAPLDTYEEEWHGAIRRPYYHTTIVLIQTLRKLRAI